MAITEESRHEMDSRLEQTFGHEVATTLMEHLPPVGWADVATKRDLDVLRLEWRAELNRGLRNQLAAFVAINSAMVAVLATFLR